MHATCPAAQSLCSPAMAALLSSCTPLVVAPGGAGMTTPGGWPAAWVQVVRLKLRDGTEFEEFPAVFSPPHSLGLLLASNVLSMEKLRTAQVSCAAAKSSCSVSGLAQGTRGYGTAGEVLQVAGRPAGGKVGQCAR